ncbi:unnamed protein product [Pieris macdunnoughi]|uniref:Uncharacterized protein n=1 Tax=Pieris macdunnoughi TaxID=345717 RepID=A0A821WKT7_9NEOP|nr:unnamed protein product [Pieris macdunnoughi]
MAVTRIALFIIFILPALAQDSFTPQITVQAFKPKGFRIYLPGDAKIKFLRIQVELNSTVHKYRLDEFVFHETKGYWVFEKPDIKLRIDDVIRYDIFLCTKNSIITDPSDDSNRQFFCNGYVKADTFNVTNLDERNELPPVYNRECLSEFRLTKVPNGEVCAGDVLLEEHFDDLLNPELWEVQHYIPMDHPEHPFVSYQNIDSGTVYVSGGSLNIQAMIQTELQGYNQESLYKGSLDLYSGCTGRVCAMHAMGPMILPPIVSGRVRSRVPFKYGTIHIRAKMPIGDWIYPEMLLEPLANKYGSMFYSSGAFKIAMARGNRNLNDTKYNSKVLQGRPILNSKCKRVFDYYKKQRTDNSSWGDDFHIYSLTWQPGLIQLSIDGTPWVTYTPGSSGLRSWLPKACRQDWYTLLAGPKIAPFDQHFYLSLGVAVGGTFEFPDNVVASYGKPWKNSDSRAARDFWNARLDWLPTWTQPVLSVDYVKIVAI